MNEQHRRLWLMGFDKAQREIIIDVAPEIGMRPVNLGIFLLSRRAARDLEKLKTVIAPVPWYISLWLWIRYAWHWVSSWRLELKRQ